MCCKMRTSMLLLFLIPTAVMGNKNGPPVSTHPNLCTAMIPVGHNNGVSRANDTDSPPYTITTSSANYTANGSLTVTISAVGPTFFEGFFIQARRADLARDTNVSVGEFAYPPPKTQLLKCHSVINSAWSHSDDPEWTKVSAVWKAPAQDEGPIEFKATIVKGEPDRSYFYLDVKSEQKTYMDGDAITVQPPTTLPVTTDTTEKPMTTSGGCPHSTSVILSVISMFCGLALAEHGY